MLLGSSFLRKQGSFDFEAQSYINAVEAADGQPLEANVKSAINTFVVGCKQDGIWDAIKACCILAGSRSLSGILVPLKGNTPTNFNFVSADYNRKLGLKGNGTTKYLNTNRPNNADPQNSHHCSIFLTELPTIQSSLLANDGGASGALALNSTGRNRSRSADFVQRINSTQLGFYGISRNNSSQFLSLNNTISETHIMASQTPGSLSNFLFANNINFASVYTDARLSFYSIGESINLTLLDNRITTLMNTYNSIL
jgi:hypothetical protein